MLDILAAVLLVALAAFIGQVMWIVGLIISWRIHRRLGSAGSRQMMLAFGLLIVFGVLGGLAAFLALMGGAETFYPMSRLFFKVLHAVLVVRLAIAFVQLFRESSEAA
jgi:hypothetical protein